MDPTCQAQVPAHEMWLRPRHPATGIDDGVDIAEFQLAVNEPELGRLRRSDEMAEDERLASLIVDSISPKLVPSMEVIPWRKTQVLAVEIYPSPNRPHYLNRLGPAEGVFVRVGSTNRRAACR